MSPIEAPARATRRYRPYPAYKDSGVEWLGGIPVHWTAKRLKFVAAEPIKNGIGEAGAYDDPEWPRYVRITDIAGPRELREDTFKSLPPELAREAPFKMGDLLLAAVGATFGKSYLHAKDTGQVCFAGYLVRFPPGRHLDSSFAAYWTESAAYWALVQSRVVQATIQNFSAAKYRDLALPLPSTSEQRAIAACLDRETARIDALVAKKGRLIELLQEKRTALITRAVTKGLDPDVPMKDSGVEWLGQIPAHWKLVPSTWLFTEGKQRALAGDQQLSATQRYGVIPQAEFERLEGRQVVHAFLHLDQRKHVEVDDFVMSMRSFEGGLERVRARGCVRSSYVVLRCSAEVHVGFLGYLFKSSAYIQALRATSNFIRDGQDLNFENFRLVKVPLMRLREQETIAVFLDRETAQIDALVAKVREAIDRLKELRTALISAAVTGKIDVREEIA